MSFHDAFRAGLRPGAAPPPGVTARLPAEAARRFAVYRNNVAHSLGRALAARYPAVERLVGAEFFAALVPLFLAAHPPRTPVLLDWGAAFAGFIEGFPPLAGLPWIGDVARIEWARGRAYHAADALPMHPAGFAAAAAALGDGDGRIGLHPSVQLLASRWSARGIWAANQPVPQPLPDDISRPETALVLRDTAGAVQVLALAAGDAAALAALLRCQPLSEAAGAARGVEPDHDLAPLLALLLRMGALLALRAATPGTEADR